MKISISTLKENPLNQQIYGDDDESQFNDLVEKIRSSGWIKAILITKDYLIISGHRRKRAAILLGYIEIDYEFLTADDDKQLEIFLNENAYRQKTTLQKVNEARFYEEIEKNKAHQRMVEAGTRNLEQSPAVETFPPLGEGKTRDIVAQKVNMSGRSYDKGKKVLQRINEEDNSTRKWFFGELLNANTDAAYILIDKPNGFIDEVIEKTNGNIKGASKIMRQLEHEELIKQTPLPPVRCKVLYCELTEKPTDALYQLPISEIGEEDSVLFLWSSPNLLEEAIRLLSKWGFTYKTCMVWNKDVFEVTDNAEILTISTKGNPSMIPLTEESEVKTEKPNMVKRMLDETYTDISKVELTFSGSALIGWNMWTISD